jgi:hypothetical protein
MSSPSMMMSPTLIPIRKHIWSDFPAWRSRSCLYLDRAAYRVQGTRSAVAHELDGAAGMGGDGRIDQFAP